MFHFLFSVGICTQLHVKLCSAVWDARGGLSNINTQWHGPNWRINGGEEGLNQQASESTAGTGEYNLRSLDPRVFTLARTNTANSTFVNVGGKKEAEKWHHRNETLLRASILTGEKFFQSKTKAFCYKWNDWSVLTDKFIDKSSYICAIKVKKSTAINKEKMILL